MVREASSDESCLRWEGSAGKKPVLQRPVKRAFQAKGTICTAAWRLDRACRLCARCSLPSRTLTKCLRKVVMVLLHNYEGVHDSKPFPLPC